MWGISSFLFHLLHQKVFPNFCFFEVFSDQKIVLNAVFSLDVRRQQWKNNYMVSTNFLAQNTIGKKSLSSNFWFQEMSLKRDFFCQILSSKIYDKI